jgi:hypothetical protein
MGFARNNFWHSTAIQRAQRLAFFRRALSVAIPVFAYICRYSFEMNTKASRERSDFTQSARLQISRML